MKSLSTSSLFLAVLLFAVACTGRTDKSLRNTRENRKTTVAAPSATYSAAVPEPAHTCIAFPDGSKLVDSVYYIKDDTTFLHHATWTEKGHPHHIKAYLVRDRLSEPYRQLYRQASLERLVPSDRQFLNDQLDLLRERGPLPVQRLDGCPRTWIPLATLRGKHYVDLLQCDPVWISDTLYVQKFSDGPLPACIETLERLSPAHYRLRVVGPSFPEPGMQVDIHILDPVRQIAVIAFRTDVEYALLYAALERVDQFDLVDWDITDRPSGDEIPWDDTDCLSLIPEKERSVSETEDTTTPQ